MPTRKPASSPYSQLLAVAGIGGIPCPGVIWSPTLVIFSGCSSAAESPVASVTASRSTRSQNSPVGSAAAAGSNDPSDTDASGVELADGSPAEVSSVSEPPVHPPSRSTAATRAAARLLISVPLGVDDVADLGEVARRGVRVGSARDELGLLL